MQAGGDGSTPKQEKKERKKKLKEALEEIKVYSLMWWIFLCSWENDIRKETN